LEDILSTSTGNVHSRVTPSFFGKLPQPCQRNQAAAILHTQKLDVNKARFVRPILSSAPVSDDRPIPPIP
jgi:hypothetical protein